MRKITKLFGSIISPPRPDIKFPESQKMIGKTIEKVEFGEVAPSKNTHEAEAMNVYFTDGTVMIVRIGSNAGHFMNKGIAPNEFHTDIMLFWEDASGKDTTFLP